MSEFDKNEWLADCLYKTNVEKRRIENEAKTHIWTTVYGQKIAVENMTDSHLVNAYRVLERENRESQCDMFLPWLDVFQREIKKRNLKCEFYEVIF